MGFWLMASDILVGGKGRFGLWLTMNTEKVRFANREPII
jgi:hypothetical protein